MCAHAFIGFHVPCQGALYSQCGSEHDSISSWVSQHFSLHISELQVQEACMYQRPCLKI